MINRFRVQLSLELIDDGNLPGGQAEHSVALLGSPALWSRVIHLSIYQSIYLSIYVKFIIQVSGEDFMVQGAGSRVQGLGKSRKLPQET